jgi:hypothetical protein
MVTRFSFRIPLKWWVGLFSPAIAAGQRRHLSNKPTNQELRKAENLVPRLVMLRMGCEGGDYDLITSAMGRIIDVSLREVC